MTVKQQLMAVAAVVAILGGGLYVGTQTLGDEFYEVRVGSEAPGFNAVDMASDAGALKTLSDYRGNVVLLNIWATYCVPCRKEMPSMEQLYQAYREQGLAVVAVSVDNPNMEDAIRKFVKDYELNFDVLYDQTAIFRSVYRYTGVPESYVIDRTGTIRRKLIGEEDWNSEANRRFVERLLAEPGA